MSLPEDKSERTKLIAIVVILSIAALYVGYTFGLAPLLKNRSDGATRRQELTDLLWQAERDIELLPRNRTLNHELVKEILATSETQQHVLRPNLGNYLLVAKDIVQRHANRLDLVLTSVSETAPPDVVRVRKTDEPAPEIKFWFVPYTVNVTFAHGFRHTVLLIRALERENPLLCITRMDVIAQPGVDPERHLVSMDITWPVWADDTAPDRLRKQLTAERTSR